MLWVRLNGLDTRIYSRIAAPVFIVSIRKMIALAGNSNSAKFQSCNFQDYEFWFGARPIRAQIQIKWMRR